MPPSKDQSRCQSSDSTRHAAADDAPERPPLADFSSDLLALSKVVERFPTFLLWLRDFAAHDGRTAFDTTLTHCASTLVCVNYSVHRNAAVFTRAYIEVKPAQASVLIFGRYSFPNAHVAAVELANDFLACLWRRLDSKSYDKEKRESLDAESDGWVMASLFTPFLATNLPPNLVLNNWERARTLAAEWFTADVQAGLAHLPALITLERSRITAEPVTPAEAGTDEKIPEWLRLDDLPPDDTPGLRQAYRRDHLWLKWNKSTDRFGPAKIRDRWNTMPEAQRKLVSPRLPGTVGRRASGAATVKEGVRKARREREARKSKTSRKPASNQRSRKKR